MKKFLQRKFINFLVHNLFNTIGVKDILEEKPGGVVMYQGKQLGGETLNALKHDAQILSESVLWEVLSNEIKYLSNLRMFEKARGEEDLIMGKAFLYTLEVIDKKLKEISKLK